MKNEVKKKKKYQNTVAGDYVKEALRMNESTYIRDQ